MDVLASAAILEAMDISADDNRSAEHRVTETTVDTTEMQEAAHTPVDIDKENKGGERLPG